jgi:hypothetical protein
MQDTLDTAREKGQKLSRELNKAKSKIQKSLPRS